MKLSLLHFAAVAGSATVMPATTFECSRLPVLFMPPKLGDASNADCETRLQAFFEFMDWGMPDLLTYNDFLASIAPQNEVLMDTLDNGRSFLPILLNSFGLLSDSTSFPSLPANFAVYGELFRRITAGSPPPTKAFKLFMTGERDNLEVGMMFERTMLFVASIPSAADSELDLFRQRLCNSPEVTNFITHGNSPRAANWNTICAADSVLPLLELCDSLVFQQLLPLHLSASDPAKAADFDSRLPAIFDFEASSEDVAKVQKSDIKIEPANFIACLTHRTRQACGKFLAEDALVRRHIPDIKLLASRQTSTSELLLDQELSSMQLLPVLDAQLPADWAGKQKSQQPLRIIGLSQLIIIPGAIIQAQRLIQTSASVVTAFPHLSKWPTLVRFMMAGDIKTQANEVYIGYHARNINAFIQALLAANHPEFSGDILHSKLVSMPGVVAMQMIKEPLESMADFVEDFIAFGDELLQKTRIQAFIRRNTEAPEDGEICPICIDPLCPETEDGADSKEVKEVQVVTLCRPISTTTNLRTVKHQICMTCAKTGPYLRGFDNADTLPCPVCNQNVPLHLL